MMPHFKCEMRVFMGQLQWRVRIAVRILCISWHRGHTPKAMKYITCRVMSFRPWQAPCSPLRGLSRLRSVISLMLSVHSPSFFSSSVPLLSATFLYPPSYSALCSSFPSVSSHYSFHLLVFVIFFASASSVSWCMDITYDLHVMERHDTLQHHEPEIPH